MGHKIVSMEIRVLHFVHVWEGEGGINFLSRSISFLALSFFVIGSGEWIECGRRRRWGGCGLG